MRGSNGAAAGRAAVALAPSGFGAAPAANALARPRALEIGVAHQAAPLFRDIRDQGLGLRLSLIDAFLGAFRHFT